MATPEPITILRSIIRPDGSVEAYLLHTPDGEYAELPPDHPLLVGRPPVTPEVNGGERPAESRKDQS